MEFSIHFAAFIHFIPLPDGHTSQIQLLPTLSGMPLLTGGSLDKMTCEGPFQATVILCIKEPPGKRGVASGMGSTEAPWHSLKALTAVKQALTVRFKPLRCFICTLNYYQMGTSPNGTG